jgi:hypothetical protein
MKPKLNQIVDNMLENIKKRFEEFGILKRFDCFNIDAVKLVRDD